MRLVKKKPSKHGTNATKRTEHGQKRDSFTFQRYYFEAISTLKSKEKLELYDAICAYVFEEKDATLNSKKAESCFILIKHLLDEEWKRSDIASK